MRKRIEQCKKCYGTGEDYIRKSCPVCEGTGSNKDGTRCYNCIGWGYIGHFKTRCDKCNGKGYRDWIDIIRRSI